MQAYQSRHKEWNEWKKFLNNFCWNSAFLSPSACPLATVLPGSRARRLLCREKDLSGVCGWQAGWQDSATLMGAIPLCPMRSVWQNCWWRSGLAGITDKSLLMGQFQSQARKSGQWVMVRISEIHRQAAVRTQGKGLNKTILRWREVGTPDKVLLFAGLTKVPQLLCVRDDWEKAAKAAGEVAQTVGALRALIDT